MAKCNICHKRVLSHSCHLKCSYCRDVVHLNCLPFITKNDSLYVNRNTDQWLCTVCTKSLFPFNHLTDDTHFIQALAENWDKDIHISLESLREKVFVPFDLNVDENSPLFETDPDINFYSTIHNSNLKDCDYYLEDTFNNKSSKLDITNHNFSLIHTNIRSAPKNLQAFDQYMENLNINFTVIGLTETWHTNATVGLYTFDGYNAEYHNRENRRGGGVALYVKDNVEYYNRPDLNIMSHNMETLFIEISKDSIGRDGNVIVGVIYRPPDTDVTKFNESMDNILSKIKNEKKCCYFLGDYNINLLNVDNHAATQEFIDTMFSYSMVPCITKPTRVNAKTATLIDNIFHSDLSNKSMFSGILYTDLTDHFPVFLIDCTSMGHGEPKYIRSRNCCPENIAAFCTALRTHDWSPVTQSDDPQGAYTSFHHEFLALYENYFPIKSVKVGYKNNKPWLTDGLKKSIKLKNKLYTQEN